MDQLLQTLLEADGPPGFEALVCGVLEAELRRYSNLIQRDGIGNLIATKEGSSGKTLALVAHMDEVGFMVQHVFEGGFLKLIDLGGWDQRILPGMSVKILGSSEPVYGVFCTKPPHITTEAERSQVVKMDEMYVDTGLSSSDLRAKGVETGTLVVPESYVHLNGDTIIGKALDDRVGCYNLVRLARTLLNSRHTVHYIATVQEELGERGARVLSNTLAADAAIILEATVAADQPGIPDERRPSRMGSGAAITVADRSMIANQTLYRTLKDTASEMQIPYQIKKPGYGGTDAGMIHMSLHGVPCAVVSVPCRYLHTANSMASAKDIDSVYKLVDAAVDRVLV